VDMWLENFWIVMHLLIVGFSVIALTIFENKFEEKKVSEDNKLKFHFYLTLITQFAFGGLFSIFFIFYIRSSSLTESWLFLLLLLGLVIGNELWKKYYQRLAFQISLLFVSLYLFLVFLLPVLFHRLGADLFIISGVISLIIVFIFLLVLRRFIKDKFDEHHKNIRVSVIVIFIVMNLLYFTNIIPPIPLSLKAVGVYHGITKTSDGNYQAKVESTVWPDNFFSSPVFHKHASESVYVFSAIFSPIAFSTEIIHQWQYYSEEKKQWLDSNRTVLPISGGREQGFRTYSFKGVVLPGPWRVKVMTSSGQVLGNINFIVEDAASTPELIVKNI